MCHAGNLLPCYLENVFELLGDPNFGKKGDYYYDTVAKTIYYVGVSPPNHAVLPQSVGLLVAQGIEDWAVTGVALQEASWLLDASGFTQYQSGMCVLV